MENSQETLQDKTLPNVLIDPNELQSLLTYIGELPTKYGIPLIQFFENKVKQSNQNILEENNLNDE